MTRSILDSHAALAVNIPMGVRREEYLDHITFQANRRPLFTETFGPLVGLKDEWRSQGATEAELDLSAFRYRAPKWGNLPINTGWLGGDDVILDESENIIIGRDKYGRTVKLIKSSATLPLPLDYPVKDMDDWLRVKPHYSVGQAARLSVGQAARLSVGQAGRLPYRGQAGGIPYSGQAGRLPYEDRFGEGWERLAREYREAGLVVTVSIPGGFDEPRQLMGEEALCVAFYEQPELVHDMLATIGATAERVLDEVSSRIQIDQLDVHEDFAGKSGPLVGPRQIGEFIKPYYRRIWDMLSSRGTRVFNIDTDGNVNAVIPALLETGINMLWPMEPAAGMDMVETRARYGARLAFMGGIDKHVLRRSKPEITRELEHKLPLMIQSGGCVLGLDHRIPNGTPLENYRFYIRTAWDILGE